MTTFAALSAILFTTPTMAHASPAKVQAHFDSAFVPGGFDSNDNVQFVAEGRFKSSCYRPAITDVKVDTERNEITVGPAAYQYGGFCLQVLLPFDRVIEVGVLPAGRYKILQSTNGSKLGEIEVGAASNESPDDHLYAPIQQAFFRQKGAKTDVLISGDFPNSCMRLKEVGVVQEEKVLVLQPIIEMEQKDDCKDGVFPFEKIVRTDNMNPGRYLMHVRSMNGKSINTLVEVRKN